MSNNKENNNKAKISSFFNQKEDTSCIGFPKLHEDIKVVYSSKKIIEENKN